MVVAIILSLTVIAVPAFRFFQAESDLNNSAEQIINTLRFAQNKSLAAEGSGQWGVYFDNTTTPHQYVLFKGLSYAAREVASDNVHKLPGSVEIYNINLGTGKEIIFSKVSGAATPAGSIDTRLINQISKKRSVYIDSSGQISLDNPPVPSGGRVQDSRHIHFTLNWSIQNSTSLKFYFPGTSQTETVDMAGYFNADKSEFDWNNENTPFVINGVNQVFHIHTHSLDASSTLLCIHRDRNNGRNNQEVTVYIVDEGVDKDIAHYLADAGGTIEKGFYADEIDKQ